MEPPLLAPSAWFTECHARTRMWRSINGCELFVVPPNSRTVGVIRLSGAICQPGGITTGWPVIRTAFTLGQARLREFVFQGKFQLRERPCQCSFRV